jgi:hypothetical protein
VSLRFSWGLDGFDLTVHAVLTGLAMVVVDSFAPRGGVEDALMAGTIAASVLLLAYLRKRSQALRPDRDQPDLDRLDQLEDRLVELEGAQQRIMELEERIDFTERLLARERDLKLSAGRDD